MAKYSDVYKAARGNLLALKLGTLLGAAAQDAREPLTVAQMDEIFDQAAEFANEIGIRDGGMSDGVVNQALGKALAQVISMADLTEGPAIIEALKPVFMESIKGSVRGV
jgi:hypothetical protein